MGLMINTPHAVSEIIDGEAIVVNLKTGCYYSIGKTGSVVWDFIAKNFDQKIIAERVAELFDVEQEKTKREVNAFIEELLKESLVIHREDAPSSKTDGVKDGNSSTKKQAYEPPKLVKFEDMQDLLLLDPVHEVSEEQGWPWKKDDAA